MPISKLHLIRHAPVVNQSGKIYGDDVEFDLVGQKETIVHLSNILPSVQGSHWYSSGVERAHQSALAVLKAKDEQIKVIQHDGFREQDFGDLIGQSHEDITDHLNFIDGKIFAPNPPNGESLDVLFHRTKEALKQVLAEVTQIDKEKEEVVIFTHGGAIRSLHLLLTDQTLENYIHHDTPPLGHHAYDLSKIDF